jgi:glycosyltransferase involved in cell wall biosynthesis
LRVISDSLTGIEADRFGRCRLELRDWNPATEVESIREGWVGVMPLDRTDWTENKSGYKILQYFACGIPAVASPVGVNRSLVRQGENGYLADDPKQWEEALASLLGNEGIRRRFGERGRHLVETEFSTEKWAQTLAEVFEKLGGRPRFR